MLLSIFIFFYIFLYFFIRTVFNSKICNTSYYPNTRINSLNCFAARDVVDFFIFQDSKMENEYSTIHIFVSVQ